jgi:nucleotide-binding universal stress UspA family protein
MPGKKKKDITSKVTYLVCVSKEPYSRVALQFACSLVDRDKNAAISILHVMEPADYQSFGSVAEKMRQERRNDAEKLLHELAHDVVDSKMTPIFMVREGLIEEEIMKVIEEDNSIQMLIVGAASETGAKSKIIPPLVSQIGTKLLIPILIVPGNLTEQQIEVLTT